MKKLIGIMLFVFLLLVPNFVLADIIGNAKITLSYSDPTGIVTFPGTVTGNYYLDYDATFTWDGFTVQTEAFCVENVSGPTGEDNPAEYTLLSIDDSLGSYFSDPSMIERYFAAAWIAENYGNDGVEEDLKAAAQIAVWEIIFDYNNINLSSGSFYSINPYTSNAQLILNELDNVVSLEGSTNWALAVNPTITFGQYINVDGFQNYLVRNPAPVPEPATLMLLGTGLIGLAGVSRKKFKK